MVSESPSYHLSTLTKLAEETVVEAEQLAESIRIEARRKANAKAATILTRAEEESLLIRQEAERLLAHTRKMAAIETKEVFKRAWEELFSNSVGTEDAVCLEVDTTAQDLQVQMPPGYEGSFLRSPPSSNQYR